MIVEIANTPSIRPAEPAEAGQIGELIRRAAERGEVLPRLTQEILRDIGLFHIYMVNGEVAACGAVHPDTETLAEIRSLVVREDLQGLGVGRALTERCVEAAWDLGMRRVYALTRKPGFFERMGFRRTEMGDLPSKVFKDCLRCHLYPSCDEIAVIRDL